MPAPKGNKYAVGHTGGRPPKFKTAEELTNKVSDYFDSLLPDVENQELEQLPEYPTITGLALFLGFESRQSIYDYCKRNEVFSYVLKRAMLAIENHYETRLNYQSPTGAIFALKNMNWSDKTEVEHSGEVRTPLVISNDITANKSGGK